MEDCISSNTPTLARLRKEKGEKKTVLKICQELITLNEMLNLRRPMTENQIKFTAQMILDEFYNLNIADITLVFRNILTGKCGSLYESLNTPKILTFFREYLNQRMTMGADISDREHQEHKQF
jgi:hypothetical protein